MTEYIVARSDVFSSLQEIRRLVSTAEKGRQSQPSTDETFLHMTLRIGEEMHKATNTFRVLQSSDRPAAQDMGMTPGGFSATILNQHPKTRVRAITLPHADDGHVVQLQHANLKLDLKDINTLAGDLGLDSIPESHPEAKSFSTEKILLDSEAFDVTICGGQVTRNQKREEWRDNQESRRLELAQLIIAMEHLKLNGTLILVLHKPEQFRIVQMLRDFSRFSDIKLFKSTSGHAKRSSFYLIAQRVRPNDPAALNAVDSWKKEWKVITLGNDVEHERLSRRNVEDVACMMENFGEKLIALGNPVWKRQLTALLEAPFIKGSTRRA
ncbi:hypothetical protein BKA56DRAFT_576399 [Ilyonectria sp. MPI-CAGE-AT-0026]|nr:hypothetical protein BKA56DRAFT_576399 [Ilyonectria sp. MPI-CAGE-AT-0026]